MSFHAPQTPPDRRHRAANWMGTAVTMLLAVVVAQAGYIWWLQETFDSPAAITETEALPDTGWVVTRTTQPQPDQPQPSQHHGTDAQSEALAPIPEETVDPHYQEVMQRQSELNQLFARVVSQMRGANAFIGYRSSASREIPTSVGESSGFYFVQMIIPGAQDARINVEVNGQQLQVTGTREGTLNWNEAGQMRQQRISGQFRRSVILPGPVDVNQIESQLNGNQLLLKLPKRSSTP